MAWNAAGVQTGTDTDLTGLTAITGVTTVTQGNLVVYTIPAGISMDIQGTVSHNTELERIVFTRVISAVGTTPALTISGTYNFGTLKPVGNTDNIYTDGVGWQFTGGGAVWFNGGFNGETTGAHIYIANGGVLNFNGGRAAGFIEITMNAGATLNNVSNAKILNDDSTQALGQEWLSRVYGGEINATDFSFEGGSISIGAGAVGNTYSLNRNNAGQAYWMQHGATTPAAPDTYPIVKDVSFSNNTLDVAPWGGGTTKMQNIEQGTLTNINGGETNAAGIPNNWGYTILTREIDTDFTRLLNGSDAEGVVYMADTDNGNREPAGHIAAYDDSPNTTYRMEFLGDITSFEIDGGYSAETILGNAANTDNEILVAVHNQNTRAGNGNARGTFDTGIWAWDRRGTTNTAGEDLFHFDIWSYEHSYRRITSSGAGVGQLVLTGALADDPNVDENVLSRADIIALQTADSDLIAYSLTAISTTADTTTDTIYSWIKYNKEVVDADLTVPTSDSLHVNATLTTLNAGARNLTLGGDLAGSAINDTWTTTGNATMNGNGISNLTFNAANCLQLGASTNSTINAAGTKSTASGSLGSPVVFTNVAFNALWAFGTFNEVNGGNVGNASSILANSSFENTTFQGTSTWANDASAEGCTFEGEPNFTGTSTLVNNTFEDGADFDTTGDLTISGGTFTGDLALAGTTNRLTLIDVDASSMVLPAGNNRFIDIQGGTPPPNIAALGWQVFVEPITYNITVAESFRGRIAIMERSGTSGPWTVNDVQEITTDAQALNYDPGATYTNQNVTGQIQVVTAGRDYRLGIFMWDNTRTTVDTPAIVNEDVNVSPAATAGTRAVEVERPTTSTLRVNITNSTASTITGEETNSLIANVRQEEAYIRTIGQLDSTTDLLSFPSTADTQTTNPITFGIEVAGDGQQYLAGVTGTININSGTLAAGVNDVVVLVPPTGISVSGVREALETSSVAQRVDVNGEVLDWWSEGRKVGPYYSPDNNYPG